MRDKPLTEAQLDDLLGLGYQAHEKLVLGASYCCGRHGWESEEQYRRALLIALEAAVFAVIANEIPKDGQAAIIDKLKNSLLTRLKDFVDTVESFSHYDRRFDA